MQLIGKYEMESANVPIPLAIRQLIYQKVLLQVATVDIFMELFNNQTDFVSLDYLEKICSRLKNDPD